MCNWKNLPEAPTEKNAVIPPTNDLKLTEEKMQYLDSFFNEVIRDDLKYVKILHYLQIFFSGFINDAHYLNSVRHHLLHV